MFPLLRTLRVGLSCIGKARVDLLSTTIIRLRVYPNDLDFNIHVNNGRYLTLADIGRLHWFIRTGVMQLAREQRAFPVVGDAIAKFRRELKPFQTFEIHTRLLGWDQKWGFLEHRFMREHRVCGLVAIRGVFRGPNGPVDPRLFLAGLSHDVPSPPLPQWGNEFHNGCESMSQLLREEEKISLP